MKNILKNKQLAIGSICIILITIIMAFFCSPLTVVFAENQKDNINIVSEMTTYNDLQKNQRLYDLTLNHIATNMNPNSSISNIKQLNDFDGNKYTLFELNPIGYAIYHKASGKYVEYAEDSYSPYLGYNSNLYYGGGMQYYKLQNGNLIHTLKSDLSIAENSISEMAADSRKMSNAFCYNPASNNLSYINDGVNIEGIDIINGAIAQKESSQTNATVQEEILQTRAIAQEETLQTRATARIGMTTFFPALNTSTKMGYRNGGVCGYIATNLILGYNYFAFDYGLISNNTYINFTNKTMNGAGLTNRLLQLAGEDPNASSFSGTYSYDMFLVIGSYLSEVNNYQPWSYSWYFLKTNIKSTLDDGYPVVIFGSLVQPNGSSGQINHAVVAYDYANYGFLNASRKYRVHYGWSGYASVWLESPTIGSNCYMKIG